MLPVMISEFVVDSTDVVVSSRDARGETVAFAVVVVVVVLVVVILGSGDGCDVVSTGIDCVGVVDSTFSGICVGGDTVDIGVEVPDSRPPLRGAAGGATVRELCFGASVGGECVAAAVVDSAATSP